MNKKLVAAICFAGVVLCCIWIYSCCFAYITEYNMGNSCYQSGQYEDAVSWYEKALEKGMVSDAEYNTRINLALARIAMLEDDYAHEDNRDNSIALLEQAKGDLSDDSCASGDARQLKEEIEAALEELYRQQEGAESEEEEETEEQEDTSESDEREQSIREQIGQMQDEAYQDRETDRQFMEEFDMEINFDFDADIW